MKYYLIAGEASGDLHASNLMKALKQEDCRAQFRYFGGDLMKQEGGVLVKHYRELAFMGFVPVMIHLPTILHNAEVCKKDIADFQPDVVILVDYPGFNMKIAKFVKTLLGIPVYYYISPKIWAWKTYRIKSIRKYVDRMLSILPFEVDFYRKHHYEVEYVGNPSLDEIVQAKLTPDCDFLARNNLSGMPIVALLAGSRLQEIEKNLHFMLAMTSKFPDFQFVIAGAPGVDKAVYQPFLAKNPSCAIVYGQTYALLQHAKAALVTSGTATLETALWGVPQVVCYSMSLPKWLYDLLRPIIKVKYVSLVNLIADREVCCELLGYRLTEETLYEELSRLLYDTDYCNEMKKNYEVMRLRLGAPGAPKKAAACIVKWLSEK